MQMDQEQKKKLLIVLAAIISLPVLVVGVWTALITIFVSRGTMFGLILIISGAAIGFVAALVVAGLAANALNKFLTHVSDIADGSISLESLELPIGQKSKKMNEIMQFVNEIAVSYAKVISSIENATAELGDVTKSFNNLFNEMADSEEDMSSSVNAISENIILQADRMQLITTDLDDISSEINHISENVAALSSSAGRMQECNQSVVAYITELIKLNNENSESIEKVRSQTELTNESAMNIRTATEIIASISSQTNLLALNASIEAARAGESGKGFAVVALEIQKLAEESNTSAAKIGDNIRSLVEKTNGIVTVMETIEKTLKEQENNVAKTTQLFDEINEDILRVTRKEADMQNSVSDMNQAKDNMSAIISGLSESAVNNADLSKNAAKVTSQMMCEIENLDTLTTDLSELANQLDDNLKAFLA